MNHKSTLICLACLLWASIAFSQKSDPAIDPSATYATFHYCSSCGVCKKCMPRAYIYTDNNQVINGADIDGVGKIKPNEDDTVGLRNIYAIWKYLEQQGFQMTGTNVTLLPTYSLVTREFFFRRKN
jgi:ferredoxin